MKRALQALGLTLIVLAIIAAVLAAVAGIIIGFTKLPSYAGFVLFASAVVGGLYYNIYMGLEPKEPEVVTGYEGIGG